MTVFGKLQTAWTVPADPWYTYLVRCADGTLYCGVTNDLKARVKAHNGSKRGARYTRTRRPVKLVWSEKHDNKSLALKHERAIKKLSRKEKEALIG